MAFSFLRPVKRVAVMFVALAIALTSLGLVNATEASAAAHAS
jgi:hypothetical protein